MVDISTQRIGRAVETRLPMVEFTVEVCLLAAGLFWLADAFLTTQLWAMVAFALCIGGVARGTVAHYPHSVFGLCNLVTLVRATFVCFLVGAVFDAQTISPWLVFWVGIFVLSMDGVDGWLARRSGLQSEFGARFDMETDAALGACLAAYLLVCGVAGAEILILGFLRYAFVAAGLLLPWLRADLPESFRRKTICVIQIATLIALLFPLLPGVWALPISVIASALLVYSFAVDVLWLVRRAR